MKNQQKAQLSSNDEKEENNSFKLSTNSAEVLIAATYKTNEFMSAESMYFQLLL